MFCITPLHYDDEYEDCPQYIWVYHSMSQASRALDYYRRSNLSSLSDVYEKSIHEITDKYDNVGGTVYFRKARS